MTRVLVLMATRNGAAWLGPQVDSIAAQRRPNLDVTLAACDDASTDATVETLERLARAARLRFRWVESAVAGGGAGRNFFRLMMDVDVGDHDYVALSDQDDVWYPDKLERAVDCLHRSGAAAYSAAVRARWSDGRSAVLRQCPRPTRADHLFEGAGQGCTFVMTRTWFESLQTDLRKHTALLLERVHYHDWAIYAVARCRDQSWLFDERPCLDYRQHAANDTGARSVSAGAARRLGLIRAGWYGRQVDAIARLCGSLLPGAESGAERYLRLTDRHRAGDPAARFRLGAFVLRHGRRRWLDRAVLVGAALAGYLSPASNR